MSDLTEFLLARIAEDEADADAEDEAFAGTTLLPEFDSDHQARWHTDRARAECEAKRSIVAEHGFDFVSPVGAESSWEEFTSCNTCHRDVGEYPCPTLRHLAAIYSDHPDYDEAWRP